MAPQSPVVARRELASRLRAYRIELEIEPKAIASQLGFSRNYWSAVENSRSVLAANRLDQVIEMFGIDDVAAEELRSLWSFAKQRGWWTEYSDVIAEVVLELFGLEYGAEQVSCYENSLVTGILQTEEYSREVFEGSSHVYPAAVDRLVESRKRRQQRLANDSTLLLTAVLNEDALYPMVVISRPVLRDQLIHLVNIITTTKRVDVRVHRTAQTNENRPRSLALLDFATPHLSTIAWIEDGSRIGIEDKPALVAELREAYARSLTASLSAAESLDFIRRRIDELADETDTNDDPRHDDNHGQPDLDLEPENQQEATSSDQSGGTAPGQGRGEPLLLLEPVDPLLGLDAAAFQQEVETLLRASRQILDNDEIENSVIADRFRLNVEWLHNRVVYAEIEQGIAMAAAAPIAFELASMIKEVAPPPKDKRTAAFTDRIVDAVTEHAHDNPDLVDSIAEAIEHANNGKVTATQVKRALVAAGGASTTTALMYDIGLEGLLMAGSVFATVALTLLGIVRLMWHERPSQVHGLDSGEPPC